MEGEPQLHPAYFSGVCPHLATFRLGSSKVAKNHSPPSFNVLITHPTSFIANATAIAIIASYCSDGIQSKSPSC